MTFQGTLEAFALPDVLRFLAATAKSGCVHVDGDRGRGRVWLDDGALAGAATTSLSADSSPLHEVIFELLRFQQGSFTFAPDDTAPAALGYRSELEPILTQAGCLMEEWRALEAVVPSLHHRVTHVRELPRPQVTIDADVWPTLTSIAGGCSVADLAHALGIDELEITRRVHHLVELGVAVVESPAPAPNGATAAHHDAGRQPVTARPNGTPTQN